MNGSRMWLKSQVFCVIPEQVLLSTAPGQPPLSRWIAQMDRKFMLAPVTGARAKVSRFDASASEVTSVYFRRSSMPGSKVMPSMSQACAEVRPGKMDCSWALVLVAAAFAASPISTTPSLAM